MDRGLKIIGLNRTDAINKKNCMMDAKGNGFPCVPSVLKSSKKFTQNNLKVLLKYSVKVKEVIQKPPNNI
jgi:hypothetical protein